MTRVKICGVRTTEVATAIKDFSPDYVGYVFAPNSRRAVTPEAAAVFSSILAPTVERVGVFVDASRRDIERTVRIAQLSGVQLHGQENPDFCKDIRKLGVFVWKAWSVRGNVEDEQVRVMDQHIDGLLLDTYKPGVAGGTGQSFSWDRIGLIRSWFPGIPIIVAGGLNHANVESLIVSHTPEIVDVSSGIEEDGHQSMERITQFLRKVGEIDALPR